MLEPNVTQAIEPTAVYPNGDLLYVARNGKLLLQVDTNIKYRYAYEKAGGKHHQYEEVDMDGTD